MKESYTQDRMFEMLWQFRKFVGKNRPFNMFLHHHGHTPLGTGGVFDDCAILCQL